jgi:hypothetical protein
MLAEKCLRVQGRSLSRSELIEIQELIDQHPRWSRHRLAKELCRRWDWRTARGLLKSFAARSLLIKLEGKQELRLPPVRETLRRHSWGLDPAPGGLVTTPVPSPIEGELARLQPLCWQLALHGSSHRTRALAYLRQYHYLGCNRPVGSHLLYVVQDVEQRDLAVHLVGAAAWHCASRDQYIGWSAAERAAGLHRIGNHSRFLILPWIKVPSLASHLLGELTRRLAADWPAQHGWRLELLETFVESGRFHGRCYRAANWQEVGQTTGRTRQEKQHRAQAPRKTVWVYPLGKGFREHLRNLPTGGGAQ